MPGSIEPGRAPGAPHRPARIAYAREGISGLLEDERHPGLYFDRVPARSGTHAAAGAGVGERGTRQGGTDGLTEMQHEAGFKAPFPRAPGAERSGRDRSALERGQSQRCPDGWIAEGDVLILGPPRRQPVDQVWLLDVFAAGKLLSGEVDVDTGQPVPVVEALPTSRPRGALRPRGADPRAGRARPAPSPRTGPETGWPASSGQHRSGRTSRGTTRGADRRLETLERQRSFLIGSAVLCHRPSQHPDGWAPPGRQVSPSCALRRHTKQFQAEAGSTPGQRRRTKGRPGEEEGGYPRT